MQQVVLRLRLDRRRPVLVVGPGHTDAGGESTAFAAAAASRVAGERGHLAAAVAVLAGAPPRHGRHRLRVAEADVVLLVLSDEQGLPLALPERELAGDLRRGLRVVPSDCLLHLGRGPAQGVVDVLGRSILFVSVVVLQSPSLGLGVVQPGQMSLTVALVALEVSEDVGVLKI